MRYSTTSASIMMWATFCLLAFCAFPMTFADTLEDKKSASKRTLSGQLSDVHYQESSDVEDAAKSVKAKEMKWEDIVMRCTSTDFNHDFANSFVTKEIQCDQCYDEVKDTKDIQTAESCCKKLIAELKEEAKKFKGQAKTCIEQCAKDIKKCQKELENIENRELEQYENADNDDTKKV